MSEPRKLLSPDELGAIYGRCGKTIRRWLLDGKIPAEINEGKTIRFDPDEVDAALKRRAQKVAKERRRIALG